MVNGKVCVLVTGAGGYIGKALCAALIQSDKFYVIGVDNLSCHDEGALTELSDSEYGQNFLWVLEDLANPKRPLLEILMPFRNKVDVVVHLAARKTVEGAEYNPIRTYSDNVGTLITVLQWCDTQDLVPAVLFASTMAVYGEGEVHSVEDEVNPVNVYGKTKKICEDILRDWNKKEDSNKTLTVSLRLANVIGVYGYGTVGSIQSGECILTGRSILPSILGQYLLYDIKQFTLFRSPKAKQGMDTTCTREYVHISDVVSAFLAIISTHQNRKEEEEEVNACEVFNVGSGVSYTTRALCNLVNSSIQELGLSPIEFRVSPNSRKGDCAESSMLVDSSENEKYGWKAEHTIADAVDSQVRYSLGIKTVNRKK